MTILHLFQTLPVMKQICNKINLVILLVTCSLLSCFRKEYDAPPDRSAYDPGLAVTHTIAQVHLLPQHVAITEDILISGVVIMNDKSGNYFNKIVIQDTTGGIEICMDKSHLDQEYPVGRKIYVKCRGLFPGNDHENLQLGMGPDPLGGDGVSGIPETVLENYIVKASYPNTLVPDTLTLNALSSLYAGRRYLNTLVAIRGAELIQDHISIPYAQPPGIAGSTTLTIKDCSGAAIQLRTSGYAQFQSFPTPAGNGILTGIYTRYNNTPQLVIRDTSDVRFYSARCDGSTPSATGLTPVAAIRNLCPSFSDSVPALPAYRVSGIVISDRSSGNIAATTLVLQDGQQGICIRFPEAHSFMQGDSLLITLTGGKLSWFYNLLQLSGIPLTQAVKVASGKIATARIATLQEVQEHYREWESTLIRVKQTSFNSGGTYSGNKTIQDATGSFTLYTRSAASFAGDWLPAGPKAVTGILAVFNDTRQLQLRNLADVE